MKKLVPFFLLHLCLFSTLFAQPPGYIGKRTPISVDVHLFPALGLIIQDDEPFQLNTRIGLQIEEVVSRNFSVGAQLSGLSTHTSYDFNGAQGRTQINALTAGLSGHFYTFRKRGNIAPIGPYQKVELMYLTYKMKDLDQEFYPDGREYLGSYSDLAISLTLGTQRIIHPNIIYHFGITGAWVFNAFTEPFSPEENYLKALSNRRLRGFLSLELNAGIGLILF